MVMVQVHLSLQHLDKLSKLFYLFVYFQYHKIWRQCIYQIHLNLQLQREEHSVHLIYTMNYQMSHLHHLNSFPLKSMIYIYQHLSHRFLHPKYILSHHFISLFYLLHSFPNSVHLNQRNLKELNSLQDLQHSMRLYHLMMGN